MALSLRRAGSSVIGYDVNADAVRALVDHGIVQARSIQDVCQGATTIVLSLPDAKVVEQVVCGEGGILQYARAETLVIDTSTSHPDTTRKIAARLAERGVHVIDAPVSGGPKGALNGQLTMVLGGEAADITRAEPVLAAMSAKRVHIGSVGAGNVTKIVNNLLCAAHLIIAGEAMRLLRRQAFNRNACLRASTPGPAAGCNTNQLSCVDSEQDIQLRLYHETDAQGCATGNDIGGTIKSRSAIVV